MTEYVTIARPYAKAVFETAKKANQFEEWSSQLALAAMIASDEKTQAFLKHPRVTKEKHAELFIKVGGDKFNDGMRKLIEYLAEGRRLSALPDIVRIFERYRREAEGRLKVEITSAIPLEASQKEQLKQYLAQFFKQEIDLSCNEKLDLLGGLVIKAGDRVMDASVRNQLNRLSAKLRSHV